jgi:hypothetical protein
MGPRTVGAAWWSQLARVLRAASMPGGRRCGGQRRRSRPAPPMQALATCVTGLSVCLHSGPVVESWDAGVDGGVAGSCRRSATPVVDVRHAPTRTRRHAARVDGGVARRCRRSATPVVDVQHAPTSTHRRPPPTGLNTGCTVGPRGQTSSLRPRESSCGPQLRRRHRRRGPRRGPVAALGSRGDRPRPDGGGGRAEPGPAGREPAGPAPARRGSGRCRGGLRRRSGRSVGDAPHRAGTRGQRPRLAGTGPATAP